MVCLHKQPEGPTGSPVLKGLQGTPCQGLLAQPIAPLPSLPGPSCQQPLGALPEWLAHTCLSSHGGPPSSLCSTETSTPSHAGLSPAPPDTQAGQWGRGALTRPVLQPCFWDPAHPGPGRQGDSWRLTEQRLETHKCYFKRNSLKNVSCLFIRLFHTLLKL